MVFLGGTGRLLCGPFPMTAINSDGLIPSNVSPLEVGSWEKKSGNILDHTSIKKKDSKMTIGISV